MADALSTRDTKLIQYLNEAYGKEKELETALSAQIKMAKRPPYKKRLQDHLKETKAQAKGLEKRIKALGGKAERLPVTVPGPAAAAEAATAVTAAATKAAAATKGPIQALRGTGEAEKQLKNAKDGLWNEYEEIGNYTAIETLADSLKDTETAKLARDYRRQEERMAGYLLKLIPTLTKAVVTEEIPAAERRAARPAAASRARGTRRTAAASSGSSRSSATRTAAKRTSRTAAKASGSSSRGTRSRATRSASS
jgi:ferritin-like metal-binding protein YciE